MSDAPIAFLIAPGPYEGAAQSVYNPLTDRVLWSEDVRPELGRNLTLTEYRMATGVHWRAVTQETLDRLDCEYEETLVTEPTPITEERFNEMLDILPPCRWTTIAGVEIFHISERIRGSLVAWHGKTGGRCFSFNDRTQRTDSEIAEKFARAAAEGGAVDRGSEPND